MRSANSFSSRGQRSRSEVKVKGHQNLITVILLLLLLLLKDLYSALGRIKHESERCYGSP